MTTHSFCYVTKNYGKKDDVKGPIKGVLGGLPLKGSILGQKKQTAQCGKARAIETSSIRGLEAKEKLLINPSATLPDYPDAREGRQMSQVVSVLLFMTSAE